MTKEILGEKFLSLITPEMYIVIFAVFGVCTALKKAKFFDDRFIPLAAIALGICFELLVFAGVGGAFSEFILRGIISGMAAVYAANLIKQIGG